MPERRPAARAWDAVDRSLDQLDGGVALRAPSIAAVGALLGEVEHAILGRYPAETHAIRFSAIEPRVHAPAPRLGAHTEQVLRDLLGMPADELARLKDAGALD